MRPQDRHYDGVTLSLMLDGRVDDALRAGIDEHLASCSLCTAHLAELREIRSLTSDFRPGPPNAHRLWAGIAARSQPARADRWASARFWVAAVATFVFAFALAVTRPWSSDPRPGRSGLASPPPLALAVGDFVHEIAADGQPDAFWDRFAALETLPENAAGALDFRPTLPDQLPGGYRLAQVKLLKDVCCYTLHARYVRGDETLDVFQCHDDHPIEFGEVDARRGRRGNVTYTDLRWRGAPVTGRVLSRNELNIVVVGQLDVELANNVTDRLGDERD